MKCRMGDGAFSYPLCNQHYSVGVTAQLSWSINVKSTSSAKTVGSYTFSILPNIKRKKNRLKRSEAGCNMCLTSTVFWFWFSFYAAWSNANIPIMHKNNWLILTELTFSAYGMILCLWQRGQGKLMMNSGFARSNFNDPESEWLDLSINWLKLLNIEQTANAAYTVDKDTSGVKHLVWTEQTVGQVWTLSP